MSKPPLFLSWVGGLNVSTPIHEVSMGDRCEIFYSANNVGVLLDPESGSYELIEGLVNTISASDISPDGSMLAFADSGESSALMIWSVMNRSVVKTFYEVIAGGVISMSFSSDGKRLVLLGSSDGQSQKLAVFDLSIDTVVSTAKIDGDEYSHVAWDREGSTVVCTGKRKVIFWIPDIPPCPGFLDHSDFRQKINLFTQSVFTSIDECVTGTVQGEVVVWERWEDWKAMKILKLTSGICVNYISLWGSELVLGGEDGGVRIFDDKFRILKWWENLSFGPIAGMSILKNNRFFISTKDAKIAKINETSELIIEGFRGEIVGLSCNVDFFAVATHRGEGGEIQIWSLTKKIWNKEFPDNPPTCLAWQGSEGCTESGPSDWLVVGFRSGHIQFFSSSAEFELRAIKQPVDYCCISPSGELVAAAQGCDVVTFEFVDGVWLVIGKISEPHFILGIGFLTNQRLISLGIDGVLVDFEIKGNSKFSISMRVVACHECDPCALLVDSRKKRVLVTDSDMKIKIFDFSDSSPDYLGVLPAPVFYGNKGELVGGQLTRLVGFDDFFGFSTSQGLVGVCREGGDFFGLIGEPSRRNFHVACTGGGGLVTGGAGGVVCKWSICGEKLGTSDPFVCAIDAELMAVIERTFVLCQIQAAGENSQEERDFGNRLPRNCFGNFFDALGFYPSNWQLQVMCKELTGKVNQNDPYFASSDHEEGATLQELVTLYARYRPIVKTHVSNEDIEAAIKLLAERGMSLEDALIFRTSAEQMAGISEAVESKEQAQAIVNAWNSASN